MKRRIFLESILAMFAFPFLPKRDVARGASGGLYKSVASAMEGELLLGYNKIELLEDITEDIVLKVDYDLSIEGKGHKVRGLLRNTGKGFLRANDIDLRK